MTRHHVGELGSINAAPPPSDIRRIDGAGWAASALMPACAMAVAFGSFGPAVRWIGGPTGAEAQVAIHTLNADWPSLFGAVAFGAWLVWHHRPQVRSWISPLLAGAFAAAAALAGVWWIDIVRRSNPTVMGEPGAGWGLQLVFFGGIVGWMLTAILSAGSLQPWKSCQTVDQTIESSSMESKLG